jgi:hypothetical protein
MLPVLASRVRSIPHIRRRRQWQEGKGGRRRPWLLLYLLYGSFAAAVSTSDPIYSICELLFCVTLRGRAVNYVGILSSYKLLIVLMI